MLLWVSPRKRPERPAAAAPVSPLFQDVRPVAAIKPYDPQFARGVVELGRAGLSRAEMAARIGVSVAAVEGWMAEHAEFAEAMALAETEARAWWDALPRDAMARGVSFRADVWSKVMAQRYGSLAHRPRHAQDPDGDANEAAAPRARVELPRNGREVRVRR
jgi:hypothetical protein